MPRMNGLTAGRILNGILPGIPLILFTSFGALLTSDVVESAGFSALIPKEDAGKLLNTAQSLLKAA